MPRQFYLEALANVEHILSADVDTLRRAAIEQLASDDADWLEAYGDPERAAKLRALAHAARTPGANLSEACADLWRSEALIA